MKTQARTFTKKDYTFHILFTSSFHIAPAYLFSGAQESDYRDSVADELSDDKLTIPVSVLVIEHADKKILIDTGIKTAKENAPSILITGLQSVSIAPEEITDIVITHGHNDHIGGILTEGGDLFFPNAKYHLTTEELSLWKDVASGSEKPLGYISTSTTLVEKYPERLVDISSSTDLCEGISIIPSLGHTDGHLFVEISLDDFTLLHTGDLFVHPLHILHPDWHVKPEMNPDVVSQKRAEVIARSEKEEDLILFSNHLPSPATGKIKKIGNHYSWLPIDIV